MRKQERIRLHRLRISRQLQRRANFSFVTASLSASEEELAGEDFVDQSAFIRGAAGSSTHGFEISDSDGNEMAVEADNEAAEGDGIGAEEGIATIIGGFTVREEVGRANAEVDEDAVGDGGVRRWRSRGGRGNDGGGEREGSGEKEERAAGECDVSGGETAAVVRWR